MPERRDPAIRVTAMPADANAYGDIFGGWLVSLMDSGAGLIAARRSKGRGCGEKLAAAAGGAGCAEAVVAVAASATTPSSIRRSRVGSGMDVSNKAWEGRQRPPRDRAEAREDVGHARAPARPRGQAYRERVLDGGPSGRAPAFGPETSA